MSRIRKIKKEGNLPDYYYVLPNDDRIDILVLRSKKGNTYTMHLPQPHGVKVFHKMNDMREFLIAAFGT